MSVQRSCFCLKNIHVRVQCLRVQLHPNKHLTVERGFLTARGEPAWRGRGPSSVGCRYPCPFTLTVSHGHTHTRSLTHSHNHSYTPPPPIILALQSGRRWAVPGRRGDSRPRENQLQMCVELTSGRPWLEDLVTPVGGGSGEGNCVSTLAHPPQAQPLGSSGHILHHGGGRGGGASGTRTVAGRFSEGQRKAGGWGGGQDRARKTPETPV